MMVIMDPDNIPSNSSESPSFNEMVETRMSRRNFMLQAGAFAALSMASYSRVPPSATGVEESLLSFEEVPWSWEDGLQVPTGYSSYVLARWGDPLVSGVANFHPATITPEMQRRSFGTGCDYTAFFPDAKNNNKGVLCVNHEFPDRKHMFSGLEMTKDRLHVELLSLGVSVLAIKKDAKGKWEIDIDDTRNRRILAETACRITGPVAGHPRMFTNASKDGRTAYGTLGNCAGGVTPWGTYLTAEENVQDYFTGDPSLTKEASTHKRFGLSGKKSYGYERVDSRFDLQVDPQQPLHFGWIVEIDPQNPDSVPRKLTALGRMKHECATTILGAKGHLVVYTGDDQVYEYLYKYVSTDTYREGDRAHNESLLDDGVLHVAKFFDDGSLHWLPLIYGSGPLTNKNGFSCLADVLLDTRHAADLLGATPMDRPEDIEISPKTGNVFVFLTGNKVRKNTNEIAGQRVNCANPVEEGIGHIIEISSNHDEAKAEWGLLLHCGHRDPSEQKQSQYHEDTTKDGRFAYPDNGAFDPFGRLWIVTDSYGYFDDFPDGVWVTQVEGENRAKPMHFANCPKGSEGTGPTFTPDGATLFLSIQHPGGGTAATPETRWPDFKENMPPRSSIAVIQKDDGGVIGS
jgi:secreted PhoX family phosphatase